MFSFPRPLLSSFFSKRVSNRLATQEKKEVEVPSAFVETQPAILKLALGGKLSAVLGGIINFIVEKMGNLIAADGDTREMR